MDSDRYLRLLTVPEERSILLISNSGDCMRVAAETAQGVQGVQSVEVDDLGMSNYVAPMSYGAPTDEEAQHELYKYRVVLDGASVEQVAPDLHTRVQTALMRQGIACSVTVVDEL